MNLKVFKVADEFAYSISQGLLAFTNPLQAAINDNERARDEALKTAKANNDAVGQVYAEQQARVDALDQLRINDLYAVKVTNETAAAQHRALTEIEAENIARWTAEADLAKTVSAQVIDQLSMLGDHYVSMADVTELYLKRELQLKEQFYAQSLGALEDAIKRLTYGDLSGVSGAVTLEGLRGTYSATLAQARAGSDVALQNLAGQATDYVSQAHAYLGNTQDTFRIVAEVRQALQELDNARRGDTPTATTPSPDTVAVLTAQQQTVDKLVDDNAKQRAQIDELLRELRRQNARAA
jgi:hypothetical protein